MGTTALAETVGSGADPPPEGWPDQRGDPHMLGRKDYTQQEIDHARAMVDEQLTLVSKAKVTQAGFEAMFFNTAVLALDRLFVHRVRTVTGKDTNPLSELELICDSLMLADGVMTTNKVIKYVPADSVVQLEPGDQIQLTACDFERLATACLDVLETRFLA